MLGAVFASAFARCVMILTKEMTHAGKMKVSESKKWI
jgi:hypothetical protein